MRNISFRLTKYPFLEHRKTVTRRSGWSDLAPGTELQGVFKSQGLSRGERVEKLGRIRVVSVRPEPLNRLIDDKAYGLDEMIREGFPGLDPAMFVKHYLTTHVGGDVETSVNRIEYVHLDPMGDALEQRRCRWVNIIHQAIGGRPLEQLVENRVGVAVLLGSTFHQDLLQMSVEGWAEYQGHRIGRSGQDLFEFVVTWLGIDWATTNRTSEPSETKVPF